MSGPACMGGWCSLRNGCPNYLTRQGRGEPAERLCVKGADGVRKSYAHETHTQAESGVEEQRDE
jgi:hypothetical protein